MKSHPFAPILAAVALFCAVSLASAQLSTEIRDKLHPEIHGYAAQTFLYSDRNNWNTTNSTSGSFAWSEAVTSVTAQPFGRLHLGAQGRFFRLGSYGNKFSLDWASAEFKVNERLGFRGGKVKTPLGMLNETQDIDPAHLWILLPQSIYPLASRSADLAHTGGIVFGTIPLGEALGKFEYRAYGGQRSISTDNGLVKPLADAGITFPTAIKGPAYGVSLRWRTPVRGLMVGITEGLESLSSRMNFGPLSGTLTVPRFNQSFYFARYERDRLMLATEYSRFPTFGEIQFAGLPLIAGSRDIRAFYGMATYKVASRLTAGTYYSRGKDVGNNVGVPGEVIDANSGYQNDWTLSGRYDVNSYLYLKAEQHFIDGTLAGYDTSDNLNGLSKTSHLSLIKLGVSF